ncbi:histone-lysine N-methyltransferase ASHR2 [Macadamia integrifolia]|uniref:histone-lysine N-methyltransferase ASHR2 n=1 Tax=Macadamia integrifolia TaxID=60698 RepID=UPI001C4FB45F|nr:histone-lysine N-methyltransferase ASHR2 [Macadamia integrifolia]XP_042496129.1 histone-lysine N-methyltransferase ASHR2 [Macadamia integrifolia]
MSEITSNPLIKVKEIEGRGRALIASQSVKPGQVLLRDSPILVYSAVPLQNGVPSNFCSNCFRRLDALVPSSPAITCNSCSINTLFCSPNCQSIALASSHSPWVCQALNCIRNSQYLTPDLQIQAQFLVSAYNLTAVSPSNFQLLLSLQGEPPSTQNAETLLLHSFIASLLPPQSFAGFSPELTAALLAKDKQNAFGLMQPFDKDKERTVRAYVIYPKASFFNHDCLPNACRFDYVDSAGDRNTDVIVRAIHDIPEGQEICLSYFPVNWNYADRQRRLLEDYGFTCQCDRCKVEMNWKEEEEDGMEEDNEDDEQMEGSEGSEEDENAIEEDVDFPHAYFFLRYLCDTENCGGTLAPLPPSEATPDLMECNVCGRIRSQEEVGEESRDGIMVD